MPDYNLLLNGVRFATALPGYLRKRISLEEARAIVRQRIEERELNFLRLVKTAVFSYSQSPYRPLFDLAGCDFADLRESVERHGLEQALHSLRAEGVFIKFEEFKGRQPIIRGDHSYAVKASDFDNPFLKKSFIRTSSGSTGRVTRSYLDLEYLEAQAPSVLLAHAAHDVLSAPVILWMLPVISIGVMLRWAVFGKRIVKWYVPTMKGLAQSKKYKLASLALRMSGVFSDYSVPKPQQVGIDDPRQIVRTMKQTLERHGACMLVTFVSMALRVCLEAQKQGIDLTGASILAGGEPPTKAKIRSITATGAHWFPGYWFSEGGAVAKACANPHDENDLHLFEDMFGLIQHRRQVPGHDLAVDAFLFSSLLPVAPKIMINVELDDYGLIERRNCGCPLHAAGYHTHLRNIRSFSKLCCEGMTLLKGDMMHILDEVLPNRFGGSGNDYQLWEEEDSNGFTRMMLIIDPKVTIANEQDVLDVVFDHLKQGSPVGETAQSVLQQASSMKIKRAKPALTASGKLLPLHLKRSR